MVVGPPPQFLWGREIGVFVKNGRFKRNTPISQHQNQRMDACVHCKIFSRYGKNLRVYRLAGLRVPKSGVFTGNFFFNFFFPWEHFLSCCSFICLRPKVFFMFIFVWMRRSRITENLVSAKIRGSFPYKIMKTYFPTSSVVEYLNRVRSWTSSVWSPRRDDGQDDGHLWGIVQQTKRLEISHEISEFWEKPYY